MKEESHVIGAKDADPLFKDIRYELKKKGPFLLRSVFIKSAHWQLRSNWGLRECAGGPGILPLQTRCSRVPVT